MRNFKLITLKFSDDNKSLEPKFLDYYFKKKLMQQRFALILGLAMYLAFGILDTIMMPENKTLFLILRFLVMAPVVIITLILSIFKFYRKFHQLALFIINLVAAGIIITMILVSKPPGSYLYYAGEMLVILFAFTFSSLRFFWSLILSFFIIAFYEISAVWIVHTPITIIINNNFFFLSTTFLSLIAAYFIEKSLRNNFYHLHLLAEEKNKVSKLNTHLENQVLERTEELHISYQDLEKELTKNTKLLHRQEILQKQLVQSQKMKAIGHLAGGVAHDFNNLLTVINGYSEIMLYSMQKNDSHYEEIEQIFESGQKAASLTAQLLAFSRKQLLQPEIIDINESVKNFEKMINRLLEKNIELSFEYFDEPLKVKVDPGQLEQVILNLVINAKDAMPKGGKLHIATSILEIINDNDTTYYAKITIADTGNGMKPKILNHIFEPFFTTKELGKGTGLGLSTVYGIIKQSGGNIQVNSELKKGSKFSIQFPISTSKIRINTNDPNDNNAILED